jgi:hypothetical protein
MLTSMSSYMCALEGPMAELLTQVDPDKYQTYMVEEKGKKVLHVKLQKDYMAHYKVHYCSGRNSLNS